MRGPAPFGLRRQDGWLVPDPLEAPVVRQMAEAYLASGGRMKATAAALNEKGRRTRRGGPWSDVSVARVLRRHESLKDLVQRGLWERCRALLVAQANPEARAARRAVHPLGSVVRCMCGGQMYVRGQGSAGKFACQTCRAKIPQETLERLFCEGLSSVEMTPTEILDSVCDNPRAAELTRIMGSRSVPLSEVWPALTPAERQQLVDLAVSHLVVDDDEVSVVFAVSGCFPAETGSLQGHLLLSSHGCFQRPNTATSGDEAQSPPAKPAGPLPTDPKMLPMLLSVGDAARLLRTSKKGIYAMAERAALPGATRIGRRLLVRRDDLLRWISESRAPSLEDRR